MKTLLTLLSGLLISLGIHAQTSPYQAKSFTQGENTLPYRILYPKGFDKSQQYPLVLFLHGAGERGSDNISQLVHGADLFASEQVMNEYPAIVVFPQVPEGDYWANVTVTRDTQPLTLDFDFNRPPTQSMTLLTGLLDSMLEQPFIDSNRVYVGGLSMGGMGTFELLARRPEVFAAAIAICGGGDPAIAQLYREGLPVWAFHGEKDNVVDPNLSPIMVDAINANGGHARLTLYPDADHNSWDRAFAEPELLSWLFAQRLNN